MQYVIILNQDGTRKTSYPVDPTTPGLTAVRAQAEKENPGAQILVSAEDGALHHALSAERAYWDGENVQIRPLLEPTAEEVQAKALAALDAEYSAIFADYDAQIIRAVTVDQDEDFANELRAEKAEKQAEYVAKRGEL